jgi:tetratricopeptide (TPR) repeat protein
MSSQEIFALRKQGRSAEALELARATYQRDTADVWFLRAYAWALYDRTKQEIDAFESKQISVGTLNERLSPLMREYARLASPLRGDSAFSQMIRLAVRVAKDWHDFLAFAKWAGINDFAEEDKAGFVNDQGKATDGLRIRFIRAVCRETVAKVTEASTDHELISWGNEMIEQALLEAPNDQWLNYYRSKLHQVHGESDQAIKRLMAVLQRQSRAAWPWALLGEILTQTRLYDAITCFAYATQVAREEQEVAKVRIQLAHCLSRAERFSEAAKQANMALQYRERNGFRVTPELQQLLSSDWYQKSIVDKSMAELPNAEKAALGLLQEINLHNLMYTVGVIDHVNAEKGLTYVATGVETGLVLSHRKFSDSRQLEPGTIVDVGCIESGGMPHAWRLSTATEIEGLCQTFSGSLVRNEGKDFAFVRTSPYDVFVPPELASKFEHGQTPTVACRAIRRKNKQGKVGWRAVSVICDPLSDPPR